MKPTLLPFMAAAAVAGRLFRDDTVGADGSTPAAPAPVPAAPNEYVDMQKQNFHFKKEKDVVGEDGKVLEEGKKHPTVEMYLPVPKNSRLVEFLSDASKYAKEVELIRSAVFDVIYNVARGQINDFREKDATATVTPAILNYDQMDWTAIANTPKSQRGAYAPSEEELKSFLDSYMAVMPEATGKSEQQIKNHVALFAAGFKKQKGQKDILELFAGMLQIYLSKAPVDAVEENQQVVEYFADKLERWLKAEDKVTMDML